MNLAMTDYLFRHPTEQAETEKIHDEECVVNIFHNFKTKHEYR